VDFQVEIIQYPEQTATPKKKAKTTGKKQAATKEPVEVQDYDCTKNAAMKCCCCCHTNSKGTYFPSCPNYGDIQNDKITIPDLLKDVRKYSCKFWDKGILESCFTCGNHQHSDVLAQSCPVLLGTETLDGEEAQKIQQNSRKIRCVSWISKAESMDRAAKKFNSPEEVKHREEFDRPEESIAKIMADQRAAHPDWHWELWKIEPHPASHPEAGTDYEWLWEIFPKETNAKSYLKTMLRVEGKDSKRKWEIRERIVTPQKEQPPHGDRGSCGICGHHKGRKTFYETCPRLGDLLFKGGTKSAKVLMDETSINSCEHWIQKPKKKCQELNDVGGCMVGQDCSRKTEDERRAFGCHIPITDEKKPAKKKKESES
jgi:hypothetical protein